ncbi:MAG: Hpt domain-containing protein, partial [Planctomycetota bacterium]
MSEPQSIARDEFFDSLLGDFLDESSQLLDRLNENLLQLDEWVRNLDEPAGHRCDDDLLNEMFRAAHSLKGLSAMLGLTDINTLTHKVENIFDAARKEELPITGDVVELVFRAIDRLGGLVETLKNPSADQVECDSVIQSIGEMLQSAGVERKQTTQADAERALTADTDAAAAPSPPAESSEDTPQSTMPCDAVAVGNPSNQSIEPSGGCRATSIEEPDPNPPQIPAARATAPPAAASPAPSPPPVDHFAGLDDETEISTKYLSIFIDETELSLDSLTETLLALEGGGSPETIDRLLVIAHRIKGSAASIGLNRPAKLAHLMEDLLQNLSETRRLLTPQLTDSMLLCTDALRQYVEGLKSGRPQSSQFNHLAHELLLAQQEETAEPTSAVVVEPSPSATAAGGTTFDLSAVAAQVPGCSHEAQSTLVGHAEFQPGLALVGLKARLIFEKLSNLGEVCHFQPPPESLDELESLAAVSFAVVTDRSAAEVQRKLRVAGVERLDVAPLTNAATSSATDAPAKAASEEAPAPSPAKAEARLAPAEASSAAAATADRAHDCADASASKARPGESNAKPNETLRVDIERLDQLMNLAGQLVINKARFSRIGDKLKGTINARSGAASLRSALDTLEQMASADKQSDHDLPRELENMRGMARRLQHDLEAVQHDIDMLGQVRGSVNDLFETIHQLDRVSDGIQQSVMDTRMLPIGPLFSRFKRVVRDITRANGKQINLVINGEKTELDKRMIDELSDPLIHMVRNAADHGIEPPEVREAAGKPRQGTIILDAFHRGNSIYIQVTDDGKGLDADRIRRKAIDRGLISEADAEKLTRQQIYQLIWEPGLSTAEKVTEVSGRGMGMDIVKSKIEELNG